jgi:hypothetical protein
MTRRFPLHWSIEELEACFVMTDSAGQKLAYLLRRSSKRPISRKAGIAG